MRKLFIFLSLAIIASLTLVACGSSSSGGGNGPTPTPVSGYTEDLAKSPAGPQFDSCNACHDGVDNQGADMIASVHVSKLYPSVGGSASCKPCHGDAGVPFGGVGATDNSSSCANCHKYDGSMLTEAYNHEDEDFYPYFSALKDNKSAYGYITCTRCHGDNDHNTGGHNYKNDITRKWYFSKHNSAHAPTCTGCHNPHTLELTVRTIDNASNNIALVTDNASKGYITCVSCHRVAGTDTWVLANGNSTAPEVLIPVYKANIQYGLPKSHLVDNNSVPAVSGYGISVTSQNACSSCHDVHATTVMGQGTALLTADVKKLADQTGMSNHAGMLGYFDNGTGSPYKIRRGNASHPGCTACHAADNASAAISSGRTTLEQNYAWDNRTNSVDVPRVGASNRQQSNMGCVTCHDMSAFADKNNRTSFKPALKTYNSNTRAAVAVDNFTFTMSLTNYNAITSNGAFKDNVTLNKDNITRYANSMLCITCHTTNRRGPAPAFFGKGSFALAALPASYGIHSFDSSATHVLGLYYKFSGKTYVAAGAHTTKGSLSNTNCLTCHGVSDKTHMFKSVDNITDTNKNQIIGSLKNTDGTDASCGCHTGGVISAANWTSALDNRTNAAAVYSVYSNINADRKGVLPADNTTDVIGAMGNLLLFNPGPASNLLVTSSSSRPVLGTAIHAGKLGKQVAFDSIVVLATKSNGCVAQGVTPATPSDVLGCYPDDLVAPIDNSSIRDNLTKAIKWMGATRP